MCVYMPSGSCLFPYLCQVFNLLYCGFCFVKSMWAFMGIKGFFSQDMSNSFEPCCYACFFCFVKLTSCNHLWRFLKCPAKICLMQSHLIYVV